MERCIMFKIKQEVLTLLRYQYYPKDNTDLMQFLSKAHFAEMGKNSQIHMEFQRAPNN